MSLRIDKLAFGYRKKPVLHSLSVPALPRGELTILIGPNAAGKSTLFKCVAGIVNAQAQLLRLNDTDLMALPRAERFRKVCYMPQSFAASAALSVFEVVLLARKQSTGWRVDGADTLAVDSLLERFDISHLADRHIGDLSGGQQQLVSLCQALARDAELFLLDEPTSALDLQRQLQVLGLLVEETRKRQSVTVISLHDLSLAARFANHIVVMKDGEVIQSGATEAVFASGVIESTYSVEIELLRCKKGSLVVSATLD